MTAGTIEIRNPADDSVVGTIPTAGEDEIDAALALANRTRPGGREPRLPNAAPCCTSRPNACGRTRTTSPS